MQRIEQTRTSVRVKTYKDKEINLYDFIQESTAWTSLKSNMFSSSVIAFSPLAAAIGQICSGFAFLINTPLKKTPPPPPETHITSTELHSMDRNHWSAASQSFAFTFSHIFEDKYIFPTGPIIGCLSLIPLQSILLLLVLALKMNWTLFPQYSQNTALFSWL